MAHAFGAFCGTGVISIPIAITTAEVAKSLSRAGISPTAMILQGIIFCIGTQVFVTLIAGVEFGSLLTWGIKHRQATIWRHAWIPALITGAAGFPGFYLMITFDSWPGLLVLLAGAGWLVAMGAGGIWLSLRWESGEA